MTLAPIAVLDSGTQLLDRRVFTRYLIEGTKSPEAFGPQLACLEFRGAGVIGGSFYTRRSEVENLLAQRGSITEVIDLIRSASGSFTLVVFDQDSRDLYFLNDPLGGGFLLRFQKGTFTAVSTDLTSLRQVVHAHGYSTTRDYAYELSGFATKTQSNAGDTPFREITVEESGFGLRISADGLLETIDYGVNDYIYSRDARDEQELLVQGAEEIKTNLSAVLNYQPQLIISDITGGFDSRLVLAGLSSLNACDSVVLRSIRHIVEWEYAEKLAATYSMELTDGSAFGEIWGIKHDLYEDSVNGARKSGGLIANEMGRNSVPYPVVKLQGGYGGTFRSFGREQYSDTEPVDSLTVGKNSWKWGRITQLKVGGVQLFQDSFNEFLARRARRDIDQGFQRGIPNSHISNYLYAKDRLRYWFGQQSYHSSRPIAQFDPLYNTSLMAAAYRTDFARRRANMIGLQVMQHLDPDLLEYPFYNPGVPSEMFLKEHPEVGSRPFADRPYTYRKLEFSPAGRVNIDLRRDEVTARDLEHATRLSLKPEHIAGLRKWGEAGFEAILGESSVAEFFNLEALAPLLLYPPADRSTAKGAIDLLGVLFRSGLLAPDGQSREDEFIFSR